MTYIAKLYTQSCRENSIYRAPLQVHAPIGLATLCTLYKMFRHSPYGHVIKLRVCNFYHCYTLTL